MYVIVTVEDGSVVGPFESEKKARGFFKKEYGCDSYDSESYGETVITRMKSPEEDRMDREAFDQRGKEI